MKAIYIILSLSFFLTSLASCAHQKKHYTNTHIHNNTYSIAMSNGLGRQSNISVEKPSGLIRIKADYMNDNPFSHMELKCILFINKSTYDDIVSLFGKPDTEIDKPDGIKEICYKNNFLFDNQLFIFDNSVLIDMGSSKEAPHYELELEIEKEFNNLKNEINN